MVARLRRLLSLILPLRQVRKSVQGDPVQKTSVPRSQMTTDEKLADAIKWIDELRVERDALKTRNRCLEIALRNIKVDMENYPPVFPEDILAEIAEVGL